MKILWLSHLIPYPPKGGVLQRSYNMLNELARYHEVDLLAFNQPELIGPLFDSIETGISEAHAAISQICNWHDFFEIPRCSTTFERYLLALKSLFYEPYNINWLKSSEFVRSMKKRLLEINYDLVHFDTISLLPYLHLIPNFIATTLDHHNIESHMLLRRARNETNLLKRYYYWQEGLRLARYERQYCPQYNLNITCSDIDTKRLQELAPRAKVITIPNGVDLNYFQPNVLPLRSNRLIFVGTMNWYPNIDAVKYIANKLWPILKQMHPDLECDIIGASPPAEIIALADRLPGFLIHGFVDDVRPYIEAASVYVCPIRDGGGTKLKILDAMALGKAIVAHPLACEGINVKHNHDVLLANDAQTFISYINELLVSEQKKRDLGKSARLLVESSYGYDAIGKQLSDAFQTCVR